MSEKIKKLKNDIQKFIKENTRTSILIGAAVLCVIIAAVTVALVNSKKAGSKTAGGNISGRGRQESAEDAVLQSTEAYQNILPLSADGPMFPELSIDVPTEEPAPEFLALTVQHEIVKDVQQRLMDLGFMDNDEPTDYYGNATENAVKIFQRQHGLDMDGIVGPETLALMMSDDARYYAAKEGDTGDDIISIQQRLYQLGYLPEASLVTGHFGEKTKEAVLKLQEINGLAADGTVGRNTYNLIYSDEVKANFIAFGEKSEVVLAAQKRLFNLGYMTTTPDGTYGKDTEIAIRTFQTKNALVVDGFLGPDTRYTLMSSNALPNHLGLGDSNDQVLSVQKELVRLAYLSSKRATGYFGEITQKAVKNFQKQNKLTQDGMVGPKTLAKLASDNAKKAASGMLDGANFNSSSSSSSSSGTSSQQSSQQSQGQAQQQPAAAPPAASGSNVPNTDANGVSGSVSNLLAIARSKIGSPYVWGSKGPNSFDCSGFVNYVLNQAGVGQSYITSAGWKNVGKYTRIGSYGELRAGDVIVVNGHVGFISTGGNLIDASSSNGRVIERPLGTWWQNHFIVGWRIF